MYSSETICERLGEKIVYGGGPNGDCMEFHGYRINTGYGQIWDGAGPALAHRVAYMIEYGGIPDGLVLDHIGCDNPPCCNPLHLKPVTHRENILRSEIGYCAVAARKTHCPLGHALIEGNLIAANARAGKRACITCSRANARNRHRHKKLRDQYAVGVL